MISRFWQDGFAILAKWFCDLDKMTLQSWQDDVEIQEGEMKHEMC